MCWIQALCRGLTWLFFFAMVSNACAGRPSDAEQYWLQLVNRFRTDPVGELDLLANYSEPVTGLEWADPASDSPEVLSALEFFAVDPAVLRRQFQSLAPAPPLAWSENLHDSALYYSNLMIEKDEQSHFLDQHDELDTRFKVEGGYEINGTEGVLAENIYAYAYHVTHGHAGFVIDWGNSPTGIQEPPGHRDVLIRTDLREIGIAIVADDDESTDVGPLIATQHLAFDLADGPFATGVVHLDSDGDDFYTPGEGLGGVGIDLRKSDGSVASATATYSSGGYRLDVSDLRPGTYELVLSDPDPVYWSGPIEITEMDQNFAIDVTDPQHDIDSISRVLRDGRSWSYFDLDSDGALTVNDRSFLIHDVYGTFLGDSNLDGSFNSSDLVDVFRANEYEDDLMANSQWGTGDWNGDAEFDSSDLVSAFQDGGYEKATEVNAIPEPESFVMLIASWIVIANHRRRRS